MSLSDREIGEAIKEADDDYFPPHGEDQAWINYQESMGDAEYCDPSGWDDEFLAYD